VANWARGLTRSEPATLEPSGGPERRVLKESQAGPILAARGPSGGTTAAIHFQPLHGADAAGAPAASAVPPSPAGTG